MQPDSPLTAAAAHILSCSVAARQPGGIASLLPPAAAHPPAHTTRAACPAGVGAAGGGAKARPCQQRPQQRAQRPRQQGQRVPGWPACLARASSPHPPAASPTVRPPTPPRHPPGSCSGEGSPSPPALAPSRAPPPPPPCSCPHRASCAAQAGGGRDGRRPATRRAGGGCLAGAAPHSPMRRRHGFRRPGCGPSAWPPEEELAVEVGDVDGVHVYHIDGAKPAQRQVLQQLAAQPARAHHQHAAHRGGWVGGAASGRGPGAAGRWQKIRARRGPRLAGRRPMRQGAKGWKAQGARRQAPVLGVATRARPAALGRQRRRSGGGESEPLAGAGGHGARLLQLRRRSRAGQGPGKAAEQPQDAHRHPSCRNSRISGPGSNPGPTTLPWRVSR